MVGGGEIRQAARVILESVLGVPIHLFKTLMYTGAPGDMQRQESMVQASTRKSISGCEGLKRLETPLGLLHAIGLRRKPDQTSTAIVRSLKQCAILWASFAAVGIDLKPLTD
jgi:hypothetical protein